MNNVQTHTKSYEETQSPRTLQKMCRSDDFNQRPHTTLDIGSANSTALFSRVFFGQSALATTKKKGLVWLGCFPNGGRNTPLQL